MENRLITKGARLMIPSTLRSKVLEQIHEGHLGIEKSGRLWRNVAFVRPAPSHPSRLEM